jgi:RNA 3'-terminal phosphate cyclase
LILAILIGALVASAAGYAFKIAFLMALRAAGHFSIAEFKYHIQTNIIVGIVFTKLVDCVFHGYLVGL